MMLAVSALGGVMISGKVKVLVGQGLANHPYRVLRVLRKSQVYTG